MLLLLEHPPVYTRTRRTAASDLPRGEAWYAEQGIAIVDTDRGGQLTYHGPGQLVAYPIVEAGRVLPFVRSLERAIVAALADQGVAAHARDDESAAFVGAWVEDRKIASIGIRVKGGITKHGLAINVVNDLAPFGWAVAVRPARRDDDVRGAGGGVAAQRPHGLPAQGPRAPGRGGARAAPADRVAGAAGARARHFVHPGLSASVSGHRLPITGGRCRRCCSPGAWPSSSRGRSSC